MSTTTPANFPQPYIPAGSAPSTAGDRAGSSSGRGAANPMASPRLKHVKGNPSNTQDSAAAIPQAPSRPQPLSGVDVHDLLNEMDNHNQNVHKRGGAGNKLVSPSAKSRESSPTFSQRRSASPTASGTHNLGHSHNYHQVKLERDMLHDRCQQLQQQVRSLQLAYKESATRRVQEEQAFREILKNERERFDRHVARFHAKMDERDTLLSEWVKAIYERNAQDAKVEGRVENIPELQQASPNVKDLRNTFSLLSARSAALVPSARQYLTPDDIDRANSASRDEALARRRRKVRSGKKKGAKKKHSAKKGATATDAEDDDEEDEEDPLDPIGAFRPMPVARTTGGSGKTSSASPVLRKKVGGRAPRASNDEAAKPTRRSQPSNNNDEEDDDDNENSTVTGSIMDIDERTDGLALDDALRDRLLVDRHDTHLDDGLDLDDELQPRPGSKNQADARKEDADRILQELVDALSLEEQLSDQELTSTNLSKHNAKGKATGPAASTTAVVDGQAPAIVTEASREIEDFLALTKQEQETDRILAEFLQQHNAYQQKHAPSAAAKAGTAGTRSSMSAGTNATFSELNLTPMSTASTSSKQQPLSKQVSVTGKSMEEYVRTMKTAQGAEHTGMFDGLHGMDDTRDLEQQLQDILQSVSDITKSFASTEDSAILAATAAAMASAPTATATAAPIAAPAMTSSGKHASPTKKPSVSAAGDSLISASSGSAKKVRVPTEEDEQAAKIYELLQYASDSIEEADALAGYERQHQPPVTIDESLLDASGGGAGGTSTKKKKKRASKSVSIQLSPEAELRQIVQDTVKSTAEVTSSSTKQGQVAHATRELQNVVLRSSMDMSGQSASMKQATAAASAAASSSSSSTKQTGNKSRVASINASSAAALSSTAAGVAAASSVASNSSSKAQQMVETYLGASSNDALALMGRASNGATPVSNASSKAAPLRQSSISSQPSGQKPPDATSKGAAVGQEGSLASDNKYWWDISISGSLEAGSTRPGVGGAGGAAAAIGGDSLSDSLKLGGELDQH